MEISKFCKQDTSLAIILSGILSVAGCSPAKTNASQTAANPTEALEKSKSFSDDKQRLDFLIAQAKGFLKQNRSADAIEMVDAAMKIDKWGTKELDELAAEASSRIFAEGIAAEQNITDPAYIEQKKNDMKQKLGEITN